MGDGFADPPTQYQWVMCAGILVCIDLLRRGKCISRVGKDVFPQLEVSDTVSLLDFLNPIPRWQSINQDFYLPLGTVQVKVSCFFFLEGGGNYYPDSICG